MSGHESQRDFSQDLLLPPIDATFIQLNNSTVQPSNRAIPRQMSQLTKKNNALINSKLRTYKNEGSLDMKMEKYYKTEDHRNKTSTQVDNRLSKGERDDMVSNYFNDKKKFK